MCDTSFSLLECQVIDMVVEGSVFEGSCCKDDAVSCKNTKLKLRFGSGLDLDCTGPWVQVWVRSMPGLDLRFRCRSNEKWPDLDQTRPWPVYANLISFLQHITTDSSVSIMQHDINPMNLCVHSLTFFYHCNLH